jgi:hypothetical protein
MIVTVRDGAIELYSFDSAKKTEGLSPARADIEDVKAALHDALDYLNGDDDVEKD